MPGEHAVKEDENSDDGRRQQKRCVEAEPCEVERDLDAVVVADTVQGLELVQPAEGGPLREQEVPGAAGGLDRALEGKSINVVCH